jgi:hypothetical protein
MYEASVGGQKFTFENIHRAGTVPAGK